MVSQIATFDPYLRSSVGFDKVFRELSRQLDSTTNKTINYPPFNTIKLGDDKYRIEIAVAGFTKEDLDIEVKESVLTISANKSHEDSDYDYIHRGIGTRSFTKQFTISSDLVVNSANISNGILSIDLDLIIPENKKPRKIAIDTKDSGQTLDTEQTLLVE